MIAENPHLNELRPARRDEGEIAELVKRRVTGTSPWAVRTRDAVAIHAAHGNPLILQGEQGAGKEFLARLIHECSDRYDSPFICVSALAVSGESLEEALFGSVGADAGGWSRVRRGLVDRAHTGVLYIHGAAHLSSALKSRLARLSQYQEFRRRGSGLLEQADVRIIYGSDPLAQIDTAARSAAVVGVADCLEVLPLRERRVDIEPLGRHFADQTCARLGKERRTIRRDTLARLRRYDWPGNVGELQRVIERMVRQSRPPALDPSLLPLRLTDEPHHARCPLADSGISLPQELRHLEVSLLSEALKQARGVQSHAARLLGLSLTTLHAKVARYGIDVRTFK